MEANVTRFDAALAAGNYSLATDIEHGIEHFCTGTAGVCAYDVRHFGDYVFDASATFLARADVRAALNVGTHTWSLGSAAVGAALHADIALPASQLIAPLLDAHGLRVLLYNGEFDLDCNIVGTLKWLHAVKWSGAAAFEAAARTKWFASGDAAAHVAGYAKTVKTLTQLTLAGAGHMVPMNIPDVALAMINTLVEGRPF